MDNNKKKKIIQAINFVEELSWLFESKKNVSFKESVNLLLELVENDFSTGNRLVPSNKKRSNKQILIGCLPELFQDTELFKTTSELLDFAENVLNLNMSRASKRSRNEYIGWIVCEVTKLNDSKLDKLVVALEGIVSDDLKLNQMKAAKKQPNFSWNETIIKLGAL